MHVMHLMMLALFVIRWLQETNTQTSLINYLRY